MSTKTLIILIIAVAAVLALPLLLSRQSPPPSNATVVVPAETPPSFPDSIEPEPIHISRDMVNGLYLGVRPEEVEALFGRLPDSTESDYNPGVQGYTAPYVTSWHIWKNSDGSRARLGFVNGKLERRVFIDRHGDAIAAEPDPEELLE